MMKISEQLVLATYDYYLRAYGRSSCGAVAEELNRRGYVSLRGKPVSRMAVWRLMMRSSDGREAIGETKERVGK